MKNIYNLLFALVLFSLLFTVGFNIGSPPKTSGDGLISITVSLEKYKGKADIGDSCFIDGVSEAEITSLSPDEISLVCKGSIEAAGFLICGRKYISKNQPIKLHTDYGYFEGKISNIIHSKPQEN